MATNQSIGLDIVGLAAPLVDLGFGLAGNAKVSVNLRLTGTRVYDSRTDTMVDTGGYDVTVPGIFYGHSSRDAVSGEDMRDATLILNASDLVAAGVPDIVTPKQNDKAIINGVTWVIYAISPVPTGVIHQLTLRR